MKKIYYYSILILMIIAFFPQEADAQSDTRRETHVTASQALNVGHTFMRTGAGTKGNGTTSGNVSKQTMQLVYTGQATDSLTGIVTDCYYVFALQPKGFVIVAADDRVEPILGYSYDNNFVVENMPDHVRGWLDNYERQIQAVVKSDLQAEPATQTKWVRLKSGLAMSTRSFGDTVVGPLLTTTWDQGQYYNSLCPTDASGPAGHALTGCVATAIAQIINYWGYPAHGRGIHSYESNYGNLTVNYDSALYEYTNMPNALTSTSTTDEVNAVATLMRDCGVAVNMEYSPTESGSLDQDARAALINFYRFSPNLNFAEKAFFSDSEWDTMLHADLDNSRPVYYSGYGSESHAFVCDGYDADGYYHFNFGWGGFADGWFLTNSLTPGGSYFSSIQAALFGIVPDSTGNVILGQTQGTSNFTVDEPLEFYHLMGHNAYEGGDYINDCNNTVYFTPANSTNQIVADILDFEDQMLYIREGNYALLRHLYGGGNNDLSPVVSSYNSLIISYSGNLYNAGFKLNISQTNNNGCRMVSNITAFVDTTTVHITWTENGTATQWEIEYGVKDFALGTGITYATTTNTVSFSNLSEFTEYDFYIRSVCDSNHYGQWNKVSVMIDGFYWQDVVTSQPEGYVYDTVTNSVEISTAEELTWWVKTGNGIDGHLAADIDLSGYKWQPTELSNRNFNGHGHVITNMYVLQGNGFFSRSSEGSVIENLGLTNAYIKSTSNVGGLCGNLRGTMRNCYVSNSVIVGGDYAGGLVELNSGTIINCYVNAEVTGIQAGLMTCNSNGTIRNCYVAGKLKILSWCHNAGIAAVVQEGEISHCYSVEAGLGVVGYIIGTAILTDLSTFTRSGNNWLLSTPIVFEDTTETDLLSALNRGLELLNDSVYCTWVTNAGNVNGGYPVFGDKYIVQCPNVTDVSVQNVEMNGNYATTVSWTENGNASQWHIRYRRHDRPDTAYTFVTTTNAPCTIYGIPLGYEYDFSVRAICSAYSRSGWSEIQSEIVDMPFWTDIVTAQPAGYVEDANGNIEIYSAEGLAWLAVVTNGFHNQGLNSFEGKTVTLKSDINIEGYRWYPIGKFSGTFDGQNHRVSNIYMNSDFSGLFGTVYYGKVKNVDLRGGLIICGGGGGLINYAYNCYEISNCHSSATVYSKGRIGDYFYSGRAGALCGEIFNLSIKTFVSNCSSSGTVYGGYDCGNLIGHVDGNVEIRNCYATGDVNLAAEFDYGSWRGGLIGYLMEGATSTYNCFSIGTVEFCSGKVIGCTESAVGADSHIHYIYSRDDINVGCNLIGSRCDDIADTSQFHHEGNSNVLLSPVSINGMNYSNLLDVLNAWVTFQNDSTLRTWVLDTLTGYPVFGDYFVPSCFNPTDLTVSQATVIGDTTIKTRLEWTQNGESDHWEVLYVAAGQRIISGNVGTIVSVNSNPCVLAGIPVGQPLDFYVRTVCGEDNVSGWCGPVTYIPDKLHWTEVVTSQPEGFQTDGHGNVYISSAEGLSWLSSVINRLNDAPHFYINQAILTRDIDLSAYRWTAAMGVESFSFNGNNHVVSGLYCNELSGNQGLFSLMNGEIINLTLTNCYCYSHKGRGIGTISGGGGLHVINCFVDGHVRGNPSYRNDLVGGIVGELNDGRNVENSCFLGSVDGSYSGGICFDPWQHTPTNCYTVSTIAGDFTKQYYYANSFNFTGSGYTWTFYNPPFINGAFHTDLVDALNAWVDANNTDGRYLRWTADTNMVNGGYPIFESVSLPATTTHDTVVAQGYYCWHGKVFTSDTVVADTLYTLYGYDSVVTYHIVVTPTPLTEITVDTCGDLFWNGETYTETGDYVQTFPSVNGTDSVVILHLAINPLTGVDEHFVCDNGYTWIDGVTYVGSNTTATYTLQTADGCDSVVTLNLTVNHSTTFDTTAVACNSFDWYEYTNLTQSGDYTRTLTNTNGCDSMVILHLTINKPVAELVEVTACDSYDWNDSIYTESGNYTQTFTAANGCDSVVTLILTLYYAETSEFAKTACDSYIWNNETYVTSGDYTQTLTNAVGCDSVVTLHLTVNHSSTNDTTAVVCDSFDWYEQTNLTQSGNYTRTLTNAIGCDSVVTLHLTVNYTNTGDTTAIVCDSFDWYEHINLTQSGDYTHIFTNAVGCDSVVTLHLTIYPTYTVDVISSGDICGSGAGFVTLTSTVNNMIPSDELNYQWHKIMNGQDMLIDSAIFKNHSTNDLQLGNTYEYYVVVTSSFSNCSTMSSPISVNVVPNPSLTIQGANTICEGDSLTLNVVVSGGVEGADYFYSWNWTGADYGSVVTDVPSFTHTLDVNTADNPYFFTVIIYRNDNTGCIAMEDYEVNVIPVPSVSVTADHAYVCQNDDVILTAHVSPVGDYNYAWTINGQQQAVNTATLTTSTANVADINASVIVSVANVSAFCSASASLATPVQVVENPAVSISGNTTICQEQSTTLTASGASNYLWRTGGITLGDTDSITVSPDTTTVYSMTGTNLNGCTATINVTVTVNALSHTNLYETTCEDYIWNNTTYSESGDYSQTFTNAAGCDSVVTLHLTVNYSNAGDTSAVACDSFDWYEYTNLTQSGDYTRTVTNVDGCDSVVTLHLSVNYSNAGDTSAVACDSFDWYEQTNLTQSGDYTRTVTNANGCDSVVTLHLTVNPTMTKHVEVSTSDSCYIWNSVPYCASGDYTQTLQTVHGCDSVVILHLTITVGINDLDGFNFKIYPNPTTDVVNVECAMNNVQMGTMEYHVYDTYGKLVLVARADVANASQQTPIDLNRYAPGIYFVKALADGNVVAVRKVIKN